MNPVEARAFVLEFHAQDDQLLHTVRELLHNDVQPRDRAAVEEAYSAAHFALNTLARVARRLPDYQPPHLRLVR